MSTVLGFAAFIYGLLFVTVAVSDLVGDPLFRYRYRRFATADKEVRSTGDEGVRAAFGGVESTILWPAFMRVIETKARTSFLFLKVGPKPWWCRSAPWEARRRSARSPPRSATGSAARTILSIMAVAAGNHRAAKSNLLERKQKAEPRRVDATPTGRGPRSAPARASSSVTRCRRCSRAATCTIRCSKVI